MAIRVLLGFIAATAYQVAFNPFVTAVLLSLLGYWKVGAVYLAAYLLLCAIAVTLRVTRQSRLPGLEGTYIVTAPDWLFIFGDEQQGWLPQWLVDAWPSAAPEWVIAFSCCAWRNKLRNVPFVKALAWLHKPKGILKERRWNLGRVLVIVRTNSWATEIEYLVPSLRRFGDIGLRLDQPDEWCAYSWAFRPWGKF